MSSDNERQPEMIGHINQLDQTWKDSAVTTAILQVVRTAIGAGFLRQQVKPLRAEIEALLRAEFEQAAQEAVQEFRDNNPGA